MTQNEQDRTFFFTKKIMLNGEFFKGHGLVFLEKL